MIIRLFLFSFMSNNSETSVDTNTNNYDRESLSYITLKNAFADDERHTISDSTGAFLIDDVSDGIYILTIDGGMKSIAGNADITRQVIDVTRTGTRDSLPLELKGTGLGGAEFELADR